MTELIFCLWLSLGNWCIFPGYFNNISVCLNILYVPIKMKDWSPFKRCGWHSYLRLELCSAFCSQTWKRRQRYRAWCFAWGFGNHKFWRQLCYPLSDSVIPSFHHLHSMQDHILLIHRWVVKYRQWKSTENTTTLSRDNKENKWLRGKIRGLNSLMMR